MQTLLTALKATAEETRLRLLALCAHADLTVSDLTRILGQSQPRVSRHLKLLWEAGLLDRQQEGSWVYFRMARRGPAAELGRTLVDALPSDAPQLNLDLERLEADAGFAAVLRAVERRRLVRRQRLWMKSRFLHGRGRAVRSPSGWT